jgi:hypothetical protein
LCPRQKKFYNNDTSHLHSKGFQKCNKQSGEFVICFATIPVPVPFYVMKGQLPTRDRPVAGPANARRLLKLNKVAFLASVFWG